MFGVRVAGAVVDVGLAERLNIVSIVAAEQSAKAAKTRRLNSPDSEARCFFIGGSVGYIEDSESSGPRMRSAGVFFRILHGAVSPLRRYLTIVDLMTAKRRRDRTAVVRS